MIIKLDKKIFNRNVFPVLDSDTEKIKYIFDIKNNRYADLKNSRTGMQIGSIGTVSDLEWHLIRDFTKANWQDIKIAINEKNKAKLKKLDALNDVVFKVKK